MVGCGGRVVVEVVGAAVVGSAGGGVLGGVVVGVDVVGGAVPGGGAKNITDEFRSKIPMRRVGTPADMAATALALLSDRFTPYVTGTTVAVDGGLDLYNWIPFTVD